VGHTWIPFQNHTFIQNNLATTQQHPAIPLAITIASAISITMTDLTDHSSGGRQTTDGKIGLFV
jgi:hypothetical protein